jgi:hypothetical protein
MVLILSSHVISHPSIIRGAMRNLPFSDAGSAKMTAGNPFTVHRVSAFARCRSAVFQKKRMTRSRPTMGRNADKNSPLASVTVRTQGPQGLVLSDADHRNEYLCDYAQALYCPIERGSHRAVPFFRRSPDDTTERCREWGEVDRVGRRSSPWLRASRGCDGNDTRRRLKLIPRW